MDRQRGHRFHRYLRRFPVRQQILAMVTLLAAAMMLPIPLGIIGQEQLLSEQQALTQDFLDAQRSILLASVRIAASQAELLRYLGSGVPTIEAARAEADDALAYLDSAEQMADSGRAAQIQALRRDLQRYQDLLGEMQAAAATRSREDALGLMPQVLNAADPLGPQIEALVSTGGRAVDDANRVLRQTARRSLLLAVAGELIAVAGVLAVALFVSRSMTAPIEALRDAAERLGEGDLDVVVADSGRDEISFLANVFNDMAARLAVSYQTLEQTVTARTRDLERRSAYMQAIIEISRAISDIRDPSVLMQQSVDLIRDRFGLSYVGLFLVDQERRAVVLRAGTGRAGEIMLSHGHQLEFGEGMIGWSVANARPRVSLEAARDMTRVANPYLPETQSEAALPLRARGRVVGALTAQDDEPNAFDQEMIELLQVMSDFLAVAIENARLLSEVQTSFDRAQQAYGQMAREGWRRILQGRTRGYVSGSRVHDPANTLDRAWQSGDSVQTDHMLAVPIAARGVRLGAMRLTKADGAAWTEAEIVLVDTIVEQLGLALDSARLYEDMQIRAAQERVGREVTDTMRATVDWDDLMRTAVEEIGDAVQASRVFVQWLPPDRHSAALRQSPAPVKTRGVDKVTADDEVESP